MRLNLRRIPKPKSNGKRQFKDGQVWHMLHLHFEMKIPLEEIQRMFVPNGGDVTIIYRILRPENSLDTRYERVRRVFFLAKKMRKDW